MLPKSNLASPCYLSNYGFAPWIKLNPEVYLLWSFFNCAPGSLFFFLPPFFRLPRTPCGDSLLLLIPQGGVRYHSTGRTILYLQPIKKLTSQCEIRKLWPELTTNNRSLSFDMSTWCINRRKHKKTPPHLNHPGKHTIGFQWVTSSEEGGTNTFRPWSNEILAGYLHSSYRTLIQSDISDPI